jgi:hypothetical protein
MEVSSVLRKGLGLASGTVAVTADQVTKEDTDD